MKPIKFDLPLNGTRIATLEQLEENLTPEIFEPFRSGKLAKWLRARSLDEQAGAIEALLAADNEHEIQLFKGLCELFVREVDENDAREAVKEYKAVTPSAENSNDEETELFKAQLAAKELEIEQLKSSSEIKKYKYQVNEELLGKIHDKNSNIYTKGKIPSFKLKTQQASFDKKLQELSVKKEDILAVHIKFTEGGPKYEIRDFWCLTPDFFYSSSSGFRLRRSEIDLKLFLRNIYYIYSDKKSGWLSEIIINHTVCENEVLCNNENLINFLVDYLGLNAMPLDALYVNPFDETCNDTHLI
ncbi:hypothetical protein BCS42_06090 [Crenothrix sp. D3]|nr:hypothetical protein BCS42_06090 [Crenothrix sp. D3]